MSSEGRLLTVGKGQQLVGVARGLLTADLLLHNVSKGERSFRV
jgi:hypothetical protein